MHNHSFELEKVPLFHFHSWHRIFFFLMQFGKGICLHTMSDHFVIYLEVSLSGAYVPWQLQKLYMNSYQRLIFMHLNLEIQDTDSRNTLFFFRVCMCPHLCLANNSASSKRRLCSHIYALIMGSFILLVKSFLQFLFDSVKTTSKD